MLPNELKHLKLIPYCRLADRPNDLPDDPGVYLFFLNGGTRLLEATSYFDVDGQPPLSVRGMQHVYTGAAYYLRERLKQHLGTSVENSSLRKTLLSIEHKFQALSNSRTPGCQVKGQKTLTEWLRQNALVGIQIAQEPFARERQILERYASPFNIALRRDRPYARALSKWRCAAFPMDRPERNRKIRYK
jgi:hypothetical protein